MMGPYAPDAVLIAKDGRTITDHTEIAAELERDLSLAHSTAERQRPPARCDGRPASWPEDTARPALRRAVPRDQ